MSNSSLFGSLYGFWAINQLIFEQLGLRGHDYRLRSYSQVYAYHTSELDFLRVAICCEGKLHSRLAKCQSRIM